MKNKKDALDVAGEMLRIPMSQLPAPAIEYLKHMSSSIGMCIEVCLTAYCHYNQAVLNMPCSDEEYVLTKDAKSWFVNNKYCKK